MIIQTETQLRELYEVEPLAPFGLQITARRHRNLRHVAGGLLEDLSRATPLLLFRGFDRLDKDPFLAFCRTYPGAELLHWEIGPVMEMTPQSEPKNYLFSREAVPFHWDGAFHHAPSFLVFHCLQAPDPEAGGDTLFAHTGAIWNGASAADRARWAGIRLRYMTDKVAHYGGSVTVELAQKHPRFGYPVLRFAEPVETRLNPVSLEVEGTEAPAELIGDLRKRLYEPVYCYAHRWEDGDYLIADNHALVHGRTAFAKESARHLRRIQIL